MADMMRTDAEAIQNNSETLNNNRARRPSNSNPTIVTPGIGFEDTQQERNHNEKSDIVTNDQKERRNSFLPPISPTTKK